MKNHEVVLITGCSSGIGRDMCKIMNSKGYTVIATARNIDTLTDVPAAMKLEIDVTDKISIEKAVNSVIQKYNKIDILVNNAGYSLRGALEEVDIKDVQKIFDVNVFGIINMIQSVLPVMRKEKSGKIINIGSISGKFTQAINGGYCASKHAVEALSDALRLELNQYHIQSTVIEPGAMQTNFFDTLSKTSDKFLKSQDSAYVNLYKADMAYRKTQKRFDSNKAASQICKIMIRENLRSRYKVAVPLPINILIILPDRVKEYMLLRYN